MTRVNPLPFIALWLQTFPYHGCSDMSRADLRQWYLGRDLTPAYREPIAVDLVLDSLIAAGIGNDTEQSATVYCTACYP